MPQPTPRSKPASNAKEKLLTKPFMLCFAACFAQALGFHMYLHFPGYLTELGADAFTVGLIAGLASVAAIASRPAMGRMMDVRGRRIVILTGGLLNILALSLHLTIEVMGPWVYVVRMFHGITQAILFSAFFTYAADIIPESRRTEGIGLFGISGMLPIGLGPTAGDWILHRGGYHDLFAVSVVLGVVSFLISLPIHDRRVAVVGGPAPRSFFETIRDPALLPLWFIGATFSIATSGTFIFMKTFVLETQLGTIGDFFFTYSMTAMMLRLFFGAVPDRFGPKRVFIPALGVLAIGLGVVTLATDATGLMRAGILCGVGHGFGVPILNGLVITRARDSEIGAAVAMSTALFDIGFLVGGPLFGAIIEIRGYPTMFVSSALILLAGIGIYWAWDRGR
jgi:MFS family permease